MIKKGEVKSVSALPVNEQKREFKDDVDKINILRPQTLESYIGQDAAKDQVRLMIDAAKQRGSVLDHILVHGGPGLGKTTLAGIIAKEMGSGFRVTSGPAIEKQGDLASILSSLELGDVLFIDEIHRLKPTVEEILYSAMEDFVLDLMIGKGPTARSMRITIPSFTLIGATTKPNMLSSPLRDRFGSVLKLEYYSDKQIGEIVNRSASILDISLDANAIELLSGCSRKTPRIANRLLRRVQDYCLVNSIKEASASDINETLKIIGVDSLGMSKLDRELLILIVDRFNGGPVGLSALAASMREDKDTIAEITEPYLMQLGFLQRTHRGRIVTEAGKKYVLSFD